MKKNTSKSVGTNYFYHTLYQVITLFTPLITTPYISRVLLAEGVGQYSFYYTFVQYFVIVGNLGFSTYGQIQIARVQDDQEKRSQTFWEIFVLRFITFGLCSVLYLALSLFSENKILMIILFGLMLSGIIDISWLYFGMDDFKSVSLRNMLVKAVSIAGIFLFVKTRGDVCVYAAVLTFSTLFGSVVIWFDINQIVTKPAERLRLLPHLKPALTYFLPNIATMIYTMADKTMIGLITKSDAQNGYYEQAHKIEQILVQFLLSIGVVYRSQMARLFELKDEVKIKENINQAMKMVLLVSFPVCFGLISVSRDLVGWFLGLDFLPSIPLLKIFAFLLLVISISNCISNMYLTVTDKMNKFLIGTFTAAGINIVCNIVMIPSLGAKGAAIASVLSETGMLAVSYHYSKEYFTVNYYKKNILIYSIAASIMCLVVWCETKILTPFLLSSLIIEIMTGAIIYVLTLFILKDDTFFYALAMIKRKLLKNHMNVVNADFEE